MTPKLSILTYPLKKGRNIQVLRIKRKDYGEMTLYDIFYKEFFLFTLSGEGKILLSNWESAHKEPVCLNDEDLMCISSFITRQ